ncbi:MAG TPA: UDP-N-acetylmuramate dehydrogenase [Syntrophorhabdaceae bacterium]|nr:UDP-N-acetylmuramate dehydrogenase [Syntrophorhabdaceae bacterium]HQM81314.1 UDP-N-acetylmuramate dehydrogenase [Syntrophorhabdaceae bacterium]
MEWKGVRGTILENVPMKRYTSMKVGGPVRYLLYPVDEDDLKNTLQYLIHRNIPYRFLGNGTNVIVNDKGLNEALIRITRMKKKTYKRTKGGAVADVSGGMPLKQFIRDNAQRGLSGLENLYWIPGTVGGAIKMNAGSFGTSVSDPLLAMRVLNARGQIVTMTKHDGAFGYRASPVRPTECVLSARFSLKSRDKKEIAKDMEYVYGERKKRHPMEFPSAGSVFKEVKGEPAWKFVEKAGLKGLKVGSACVSEKHANFIVNLGSATANDVRTLVNTIKREVFEKTGVSLEEEVELWGFNG